MKPYDAFSRTDSHWTVDWTLIWSTLILILILETLGMKMMRKMRTVEIERTFSRLMRCQLRRISLRNQNVAICIQFRRRKKGTVKIVKVLLIYQV